ncbi:ABC transporter ATP-binding protein [Pseudomonadota bacterium]
MNNDTSAPLIARNLWVRRHHVNVSDQLILKNVSLTLPRNSSVGITGPSGAGKSTLALVCAGFLRPFQGELLHNTHHPKLRRWSPFRKHKSMVQMVFQDPHASFNPRRTLGEWFSLAQCDEEKDNHDAITSLMDLVRLKKEYINRYPAELSGGECQRAAIVAALAAKAEVLILDEPTSMLDPIAKQQVEQALLSVRQEMSISMLVISHNVSTLAALCDEISLLWEGEIIETASTQAFMSSPTTKQAQCLLNAWARNH